VPRAREFGTEPQLDLWERLCNRAASAVYRGGEDNMPASTAAFTRAE
jgi:hypothetical protein